MGQPSALLFSGRVRKPRTLVAPWGEDPSAPFLLEGRATENLKNQIGGRFCSEQKAGRGCSSARQGVPPLAWDPLPIHHELVPQDEGRDIVLYYAVSRNRGWHTMGFPGFVLPLFTWSCSLRWRCPNLLFPSLFCSSPTPKYAMTGSLPHPALSLLLRHDLSAGRRVNKGLQGKSQRTGGEEEMVFWG